MRRPKREPPRFVPVDSKNNRLERGDPKATGWVLENRQPHAGRCSEYVQQPYLIPSLNGVDGDNRKPLPPLTPDPALHPEGVNGSGGEP